MIRRLKVQPDEAFLGSYPFDDEDALWLSGRAPLEAILSSEGLSILSLSSVTGLHEVDE